MLSAEECTSLQQDEVLSLQSIWPDQLSVRRLQDGSTELQIQVHVDLQGARDVSLRPSNAESSRRNLEYLPPIELRIGLPLNYPKLPPRIHLKSSWQLFETDAVTTNASRDWLARLQRQLLTLWQPGDVCVFLIVDYLQQALSTAKGPLVVCESHSYTSSPSGFVTHITKYDSMRRTSTFEQSAFLCQICLEGRKGKNALTLERCGHTFCIACLRAMFQIAIADGALDAIACPDAACAGSSTKDVSITPEEIEKVVGETAFARYLWLVERRRFDNDPTTSYCPRCQTPAVAPVEEDYATLRCCSRCTYAWCSLCNRSYHGVAACASTELASIMNDYLEGDEARQAQLIKRHGRQLIKLALKHRDQLAYDEWTKANSTPCPHCRVQVERSDGCSKMMCTRCTTFFCFNCGMKLNKHDPYTHFNTMTSPCYLKLFGSMEGTQEEEPEPWVW